MTPRSAARAPAPGRRSRPRRTPLRRAAAPAARPGAPGGSIAGLIARISNNRSAAPEAAATSPPTWDSSPRPPAASTANSRNWPSRPGVIAPVSTSWAPTHSTTTTLADTRKIAMAVRIARARVDSAAALKARSTLSRNRPIAERLVGEGLQDAHRADQFGRHRRRHRRARPARRRERWRTARPNP